MHKPLSRARAYGKVGPNRTIDFDIAGMATDLIVLCKMSGITEEMFQRNMKTVWDAIDIKITIPDKEKN